MIASYRRVITCAVTFAMLSFTVGGVKAQETSAARDEVRLLFEISDSGRVVGKPSVLIPVGEAVKLSFAPVSFSVVPARADGIVSLLLEFTDGTKARIRIDRQNGGSVSLGAGNKIIVKISLG